MVRFQLKKLLFPRHLNVLISHNNCFTSRVSKGKIINFKTFKCLGLFILYSTIIVSLYQAFTVALLVSSVFKRLRCFIHTIIILVTWITDKKLSSQLYQCCKLFSYMVILFHERFLLQVNLCF